MLNNTVPYWTMPTEYLEQMRIEIVEMLFVINYLTELSDKDCRKLTLMLQELKASVENQLRYRKHIDGV